MLKEKFCLYCNAVLKDHPDEEFCIDQCIQTVKRVNNHIAVDNLLDYLNIDSNLSDMFHVTIGPMLKSETLIRKKTIARKGELCTTAFWIDSGYARYFLEEKDKDGIPKEVTIDFCGPQKILVTAECYFNGLPCNYNIELAKGSVIVPFPKEYFDVLKLNAPEAEALANKILSLEKPEGLEKSQMMKMKTRPRYNEFLRIFGKEIEQFITIKDIASCLGMQPAYLSRLRGEIAGKNK